jgi:hypothetical protein
VGAEFLGILVLKVYLFLRASVRKKIIQKSIKIKNADSKQKIIILVNYYFPT